MKQLSIVLLSCLLGYATASTRDVLDQPVSLRAEPDLLRAVSITLQHALTTSERFQASTPEMQRFAAREIGARRQQLRDFERRFRIRSVAIQQLAIPPSDDDGYVAAMLRNHARLIELIEHGRGLPLSVATRKLMQRLAREAQSEMNMLGKAGRS